ncbi:MAG: hypothetical protein GX879_01840 [Bacteroidales bacterium]|nr:hypothetical protein [Bacteroidales bacterium]
MTKYRLISLIICVAIGFSIFEAKAQCFSSTGNPIGGTANMGIMNKNVLRFNTFYKNSYSGRYFLGDKLDTGHGHISADYAVYNYVATMLAFGLTDRFAIEADAGYFINKTKVFASPIRGNGFSNIVLAGKYNMYYNSAKRFEITGKLGGKIPLRSKEQIVRQGNAIVSNHPDVQPSLGNYGLVGQIYLIKETPFTGMRYFLMLNYEHNFQSKDGFFNMKHYKFGHSLNTSFFVSKHLHMPPALEWLTEHWTVILQVRHEHKWQNQLRSQLNPGADEAIYGDWEKTKNSGSDVFFISPQINYTIAEKWNLSLMADFPLYQRYNGIQLATDYAFSFNVSWDIDFNKYD